MMEHSQDCLRQQDTVWRTRMEWRLSTSTATRRDHLQLGILHNTTTIMRGRTLVIGRIIILTTLELTCGQDV